MFSRLLDNEQFTDVLLATEGKTIRCHKVVLSACSSYFENLFMTYDEKNQIVILKDTTYDDVFCLVEFMYRGEINVAQVRKQCTSNFVAVLCEYLCGFFWLSLI